MTVTGWLLMLSSVGLVLALNAFCFYRVLRAPTHRAKLHAPLDIDTHEKLE